jgi:hypothetical protein
MGSQQLLLIVVGVVLVGIMIAIGLFMFRDQAAATNRDAISTDLVQLAAAAQKYYRRPAILGGGDGRSFTGLTISKLTTKPTNANGSYTLTVGSSSVVLTGVGNETGLDGLNSVMLVTTVWADSITMVTNN